MNLFVDNLIIIFSILISVTILRVVSQEIKSKLKCCWEKNRKIKRIEIIKKMRIVEKLYTKKIITFLITCILFACLITVQQHYNFIDLGIRENHMTLTIGVLTLYGIFYVFIQFAINYSLQNERDNHWGRSKTKNLLTDNIEYRLFKSSTFQLTISFQTLTYKV